jgi:uncharacterized coiled-coil DUF342 family protein
LNAALAATGKFSTEASQAIQRNASELQQLTRHGDEALIAATASLAQLAKGLDPAQLQEVNKATIAIADTFLKGDIQGAALLIGKSIGSTTNALTRYGIQLDASASQQDKFNQLMAQVGPMFEVSKARANGVTGSAVQLSNAIGDLKEQFGDVIQQTLGLTDKQDGLKQTIEELTTKIQENKGEWVNVGRKVLDVFKGVIAAVRIVFNAVQVTMGLAVSGILGLVNLGLRGLEKLAATGSMLPGTVGEALFAMSLKLKNLAFETDDVVAGTLANVETLGEQWARMKEIIESLGTPDTRTRGLGEGFTPANVLAPRRTESVVESGRAMEQVLKAQADQAEMLLTKFDLGLVTVEEFKTTLDDLVPRMRDLFRSGVLTDDQMIKIAQTLEELRARAIELAVEERPLVNVNTTATFLEQLGQTLEETFNAGKRLDEIIADVSFTLLEGFGSAVEQSFAAYVSGAESAAVAFKRAFLGAIASVARAQGQLYLAEALGALGRGLLGDPRGFAAAAQFGAAATLFFALAGVLSGVSQGGGGGLSSSAGSASQATALEGRQPPVHIKIIGGLLDMSDPRQLDAFATAMQDVTGRRFIIEGD